MREYIGIAILLPSALALSCKGPAGEMGPEGPRGPAGPASETGAGKATDGGLTIGCLDPCHTLNGVLPQWRTSGHALLSARQAGGEPVTVANWAAPDFACGHCHAVDGQKQRATGNVVSAGGAPANLNKGELSYLSGGKVAEANYAGTARLALVHCTTCHKLAGEDPHKTGADYKPGSFAYWIPVGAADEVYLEKSPTAGAVTGSPAGKFKTGNVCAWCHRGRRDVTNFISAQNQLTNHFWGPHGSCQADIYSSKGGYHFAGKTYAGDHPHKTLAPKGCIACHMPAVAANQNTADHSFRAQPSTCAAAGCHPGVQSFDWKSLQTTIRKGLSELQALLNGAGYLTRGTEPNENDPLTAAELADGHHEKDTIAVASPPKTVTAEVAGAIYNYQLVAKGSGRGLHSPVYTKQLLWDSIAVIKGSDPIFINARP